MQPGDVDETCADVEPLQEAIGFAPETPIADGISRFVDWFRTYHGRPSPHDPGNT
jgi:UDP-glucuronate 4-epimerase